MKKLFTGFIVMILIQASIISGAESLQAELKKCATVTKDLQRLSCYDQLSENPAAQPKTLSPQPQPKQIVAVEASPEEKFGRTGKSAIPVPATSDDFGLNQPVSSMDQLVSYIPGNFTGWKKGDKIKLANGQIWKIIDTSHSLIHKATDPKITITRGMFNSYKISVQGLNKSSRIRRIK